LRQTRFSLVGKTPSFSGKSTTRWKPNYGSGPDPFGILSAIRISTTNDPIMKNNLSPIRPWSAFTAMAIGSTGLLLGTPQTAPESPEELAEFIRMDVGADRRMDGAQVDVSIRNHIAVLSGSARTLAQSERAAARTIASRGVFAVVNQIRVEPTSGAAPEKEARDALRSQNIFKADGVMVSISGSRAVMTGKVGVEDEKHLAREIVSEVPGISTIENRLVVTSEGTRSDAQIEAQLSFLIQDDPLYDGLDLMAKANAGTVTLSGSVGTAGERDRLVRRSYVTGVTEVVVKGLYLDSDLAMEGLEDKEYTGAQMLEALNAALAADSRVGAVAIRPAIRDGVIILKGDVRGAAQRDAAEATARSIPGVLAVSNELTISKDSDIRAASPPLVKRPGR
jgi:osmotically-inducible protein OsmY